MRKLEGIELRKFGKVPLLENRGETIIEETEVNYGWRKTLDVEFLHDNTPLDIENGQTLQSVRDIVDIEAGQIQFI